MSAGVNAIPLWKEDINIKQDLKDISASCPCGWHGPAYDLLCEPDNATLYCPTCQTSGWTYD